MNYYSDTFSTPLGPFSVAVNHNGQVCATAFGNQDALKARLGRAPLPKSDADGLTLAREQVKAYFAGQLREFDLALAPNGTAFQQRVWEALRRIPYGETRNYAELARELHTAARAVGRANATNPICLIIPCHRVIGSDGSLTGFAFGEEIKRRLLVAEAGFLRDSPRRRGAEAMTR